MTVLQFIDQNESQQSIAVDEVEDIFGFNSVEKQGQAHWFFWICTKSGSVLKSHAYETLDQAREAYSAIKLEFEQGRLAS